MDKNKLDYSSSVSSPFGEKLKILPRVFGIRFGEKPEYQILQSYADKEIRRYGPMVMVSVTVNGENYEDAKKVATICLHEYLFGKNQAMQSLPTSGMLLHQEVLCTSGSPVLRNQSLKRLMISLALPAKFTLAMAPQPLDKRIILHERPGHLVGVIQYSGRNDVKKIEKYRNELIEWLNQNEVYHPTSEFCFVEYDNPITLPFLRKNEVHIDILERH